MKIITTLINGKITELQVRDFLGMYQILTGPLAMGLIRKEELL